MAGAQSLDKYADLTSLDMIYQTKFENVADLQHQTMEAAQTI